MDDDDWDIQAVVKGCAAIPSADHNINVGIPPANGNAIGSSSSPASVHVLHAQSNRRRRKNQQMKVVREMTQEQLSADSWAWRKYGQKPIKGSLYPRNYYRCSTSKGCAARKQVERSPNDAGLLVVSYTGEHTHPRPTHRSSLAGSTRAKSSTSTAATANASSNNGEPSFGNKGLDIDCSSFPAGFSSRNEEVQEIAEDGGSKSNDDSLKGGGSLFPMASSP